MLKEISIAKACESVIREKYALRKSEHTILEYQCPFKKVNIFFDPDRLLSTIDREDWINFFSFLSTDYRTSLNGAATINKSTTGLTYEGKKLKDKSILNIKINLSGLYTWAIAAGYALENPIKNSR